MSLFHDRLKTYFPNDYDRFLDLLTKDYNQGFFLNTKKASNDEILKLIDFDYHKSSLTTQSYYHSYDNIGKTKVYELGLIYPQEIASSLSTMFINKNNIKTVVDLCAAPGGKTINILNRLDDALCICNDNHYSRASILSSNLERLGLDNVIVTCKETNVLASELENFADLVILDAPCSGEGMIRKYPEILDTYSLDNINKLANIQSQLLDDAYKILNDDGILIYSTCTYSFEEDENQVENFLKKYLDIELLNIDLKSSSTLKGCVKLSPLYNTEGQFFAMFKKKSNNGLIKHSYLKPIKDKIVDTFIENNINIDKYYLYKNNDNYYISLTPLYNVGNNVIRYGTYLGNIKNNRFEPSHCLYRSNSFKERFKYRYDLNDEEYNKYISGNELKVDLDNNYYLITYNNHSLGFGKCSNKIMKNKYPKGLRRML